tara:strand:+ start:16424 stop:16717 length:294 start_codon:yes stop_codon:yes gene_type:complete
MTTISKICLSCPVEIEEPEIMDKCYMCNALGRTKQMITFELICKVCGSSSYIAFDDMFPQGVTNKSIETQMKQLHCVEEKCLSHLVSFFTIEGAPVG